MLAQNPHANLLSLQADSASPDRLTLTLKCGIDPFEVSPGTIVRVGLTGLQLTLQFDTLAPVTIAGNPLLKAIDQSIGKQWPDCQRFLTEQSGSAISLAIEGFQGSLPGAIGVAEIDSQQTGFALTGSITVADLRILEASGLWHHDISPNSHGVLERVVLREIMRVLPNPLCYWGDKAGALELDHSGRSGTLNSQALLETIATLSQCAPDLPTLLQAAQLNLSTDLVGISLMAGDLRNQDLSNANLRRSNLRGADLSDADLTEATLSYARLSGADLSGALLSNADLRGANLHRASLALANLSGADLRQADLRGANLSQVSLSGAQVKGLRWGDNEGLAASVADYLQANGAILEPLP
ncbi:MAG: pentapeptide repeat-containing protein [Prochlorotrichaceae cyanobacterium]